jgi:3-hydroxyisobutyrate dehydrogenase
MKIGWIGLGNMGKPMASNLIQAGFQVTVYNRTQEKTQPLKQLGANVAITLEELAQQSDIIITMLSDGRAVHETILGDSGILPFLHTKHIVIDMSTIGPDESANIALALKQKGIRMLDAPVSGSVKPAEDGTLVILVGGDQDVYDTVTPIFDVLGKASYYMGSNGKGLDAKLAVNLMLGITLQGMAEALLVAEKAGLKRDTFLQMITNTAVCSPILQSKLDSYRTESFPASFALKHMNKDLGLAMKYAYQNQCALPLTSTAHTTYTAAEGSGKGELDVAAIFLQIFQQSGIHGQCTEGKIYEETSRFS